MSNGGAEAINPLIEKTRRLARASATSTTTASESCSPPTHHAPTGNAQTMLNDEEPVLFGRPNLSASILKKFLCLLASLVSGPPEQ